MKQRLVKPEDSWIQTFTGLRVYPMNPTTESMCVEDQAHSLSQICRFGGHTKDFYSVCQHCIVGCEWFLKRKRIFEAKCFLVHEPDEPYIGDLSTPIKYLPQMGAYRSLGRGFKDTWLRKLGIFETPASIKELDLRMVVAEYKTLFTRQDPEWGLEIAKTLGVESVNDVDTSDLVIKPYKSIKYAEKRYLQLYDRLFDRRV